MKDGKPETLEEAITLIVQQQNRLSELEDKKPTIQGVYDLNGNA